MVGKSQKTEGGQVRVQANVRLAAEAEPLGAGPVTVGMEVVCELPDEETQRAGFYCAQADRLVALFPGRFKLLREKGR